MLIKKTADELRCQMSSLEFESGEEIQNWNIIALSFPD